MCSLSLSAQKDVTKFLGIPVDGTKEEMIRKLKEKGFKSFIYQGEEVLEGEFNGQDVHVYIATNSNKVYRIMVSDVNTVDEAQIKIRFNNLCKQFESNSKYISLTENQTISDNENISYGMRLYKKTYDAQYFQLPETIDTLAMIQRMGPIFASKFTHEQIENPTKEEHAEMMSLSLEYVKEIIPNKLVWFRIAEFGGKYYIAIFYDNVYNQANGEDL